MNALTPVPQAVRALREADKTNWLTADFMRKLQLCPIEIVNRADGSSEHMLKPSCVQISISHRSSVVQGEIAEDRLMLIGLAYDIQLIFLRPSWSWRCSTSFLLTWRISENQMNYTWNLAWR
jgi:hypothetical protein